MDKYSDKKKQKTIPKADTSNIAKGLMLTAVISGYILGPLLVLGGGGWWLYKTYDTSKIIPAVLLILAFIVSNGLIITRAKKMAISFAEKTTPTKSDKQKNDMGKNKNGWRA
jgi:hypothetical protein